MARGKALSYEELIAFAKENYTKGGDGIYECWDERTYNDYVSEFGNITQTKAREMFRLQYAHEKEMEGLSKGIW